MSEDISDIMQKVNNMIKNNQIPDDLKNMIEQFSSNNSSKNTFNGASNNTSNNTANNFSKNSPSQDNTNQNSSEMPDFDINTILKMKSIMDNMNNNQSDPRSNLLRSLKPYLRESRKNKVDEYIKLFRIGKIFEMMNTSGGEKKNDI